MLYMINLSDMSLKGFFLVKIMFIIFLDFYIHDKNGSYQIWLEFRI